MGTKTISLDEEAYERLKAHKREGESFTTVVKRLAGERSWREVTGIWAGERTTSRRRSRRVERGVDSVESGYTTSSNDRGHQFPHRPAHR